LTPDRPPVDETILDGFCALGESSGDGRFLEKVLRVFAQETHGELDAMRLALAQPDQESFRQSVRNLKRIAAAIGATSMTAVCEAIERRPFVESVDRAARVLAELASEHDAARLGILDYQARRSRPETAGKPPRPTQLTVISNRARPSRPRSES
jgi:HPt (histidine-containing phosphotransfer) domain-containing protein